MQIVGDTNGAVGADEANGVNGEAAPNGEAHEPSLIETLTNLDAEVVVPVVVSYSLRIIGVIVIIMAALLIGTWLRRLLVILFARAKIEETLSRFFANTAKYVVLVLAIPICLEMFGVNAMSFVAVIGAASLAIGLAFQGALSNMAAGVMLLIFRPFRVGEAVIINGELGAVEEITLFVTRLNRFDNKHIIMPNREVFGNKIEILNRNETRRVEIPVGVAYSADVDKTRAALEEAADRVPGRLDDPRPAVVLTGFGDSKVDWEVRVWGPSAEWLAISQALHREIKYALDRAEISIPFPQRDINVNQPIRVSVEQGPRERNPYEG